MARGWESKSVESQQESAEERARERPLLTSAQQQVQMLQHTRSRILNEISGSSNPRFRELKAKALAHVEAQIAVLQPEADA